MTPFKFKKTKENPTVNIGSWIENQVSLLTFGDWEIIIQKPKRNNDQNACLHGWINCINEETGQGIKSLYQYYCEKYNSKYSEFFTYFKSGIMDSGATSKMKLNEFSEFLENINSEVSSELGIILPTRNDAYYNEFLKQYSK